VTDGSAMHPDVGVGIVIVVLQQNAKLVPSASIVPCPHESIALVAIGVVPPVHEYPVEGEAHVTAESTAQVAVGVGVGFGVAIGPQQYCVPAPPGVPMLHESEGFTVEGVSVPEHEKPIDGLTHPVTVLSCAHVLLEGTKFAQQYAVDEPFGVPVLHTSDESLEPGWALPVHEKPIDDPVQPTIDESTLHPDATKLSLMQQ